MDRFLFVTGIIGPIILSFLSAASRYKNIACWTPSHFTNAHGNYVHRYCRKQALSGKVYHAFYAMRSGDRHYITFSADTHNLVFVGEVCLSLFVFLLVRSVKGVVKANAITTNQRTGFSQLRSSRSLLFATILLYSLASLAWLCMGLGAFLGNNGNKHGHLDQSNINMTDKFDYYNQLSDDEFICDLSVLRLGSVSRYSVQCVYNNFAHVDVIKLNLLFCIMMCIFIWSYLLMVYVILPRLSPMNKGNEKRVKGPFLTDLYLFALDYDQKFIPGHASNVQMNTGQVNNQQLNIDPKNTDALNLLDMTST